MARVVLTGGCSCCAPDWPHLVLDPLCGDCVVPPPDQAAVPVVGVLTAQVRQRTRAGFDGDGTPLFVWATVADGPVTLTEVRDEFDAEAGLTSVTAVLSMAVTGTVTETAMVLMSDGSRWRVFAVDQIGDAAKLSVTRIDQADTGEANS